MSEKPKGQEPERITVLAREFLPAAMEYHRRHMGEKGYELEGRITPRRFQLIDSAGASKDLLDGEVFYAATFVKKEKPGA